MKNIKKSVRLNLSSGLESHYILNGIPNLEVKPASSFSPILPTHFVLDVLMKVNFFVANHFNNCSEWPASRGMLLWEIEHLLVQKAIRALDPIQI